MKIITNVALAACVGISLGWMASCSTEHVTETTTPGSRHCSATARDCNCRPGGN